MELTASILVVSARFCVHNCVTQVQDGASKRMKPQVNDMVGTDRDNAGSKIHHAIYSLNCTSCALCYPREEHYS